MSVVRRPVLGVAYRNRESSPNSGYARPVLRVPKILIWDLQYIHSIPFWGSSSPKRRFSGPKTVFFSAAAKKKREMNAHSKFEIVIFRLIDLVIFVSLFNLFILKFSVKLSKLTEI